MEEQNKENKNYKENKKNNKSQKFDNEFSSSSFDSSSRSNSSEISSSENQSIQNQDQNNQQQMDQNNQKNDVKSTKNLKQIQQEKQKRLQKELIQNFLRNIRMNKNQLLCFRDKFQNESYFYSKIDSKQFKKLFYKLIEYHNQLINDLNSNYGGILIPSHSKKISIESVQNYLSHRKNNSNGQYIEDDLIQFNSNRKLNQNNPISYHFKNKSTDNFSNTFRPVLSNLSNRYHQSFVINQPNNTYADFVKDLQSLRSSDEVNQIADTQNYSSVQQLQNQSKNQNQNSKINSQEIMSANKLNTQDQKNNSIVSQESDNQYSNKIQAIKNQLKSMTRHSNQGISSQQFGFTGNSSQYNQYCKTEESLLRKINNLNQNTLNNTQQNSCQNNYKILLNNQILNNVDQNSKIQNDRYSTYNDRNHIIGRIQNSYDINNHIINRNGNFNEKNNSYSERNHNYSNMNNLYSDRKNNYSDKNNMFSERNNINKDDHHNTKDRNILQTATNNIQQIQKLYPYDDMINNQESYRSTDSQNNYNLENEIQYNQNGQQQKQNQQKSYLHKIYEEQLHLSQQLSEQKQDSDNRYKSDTDQSLQNYVKSLEQQQEKQKQKSEQNQKNGSRRQSAKETTPQKKVFNHLYNPPHRASISGDSSICNQQSSKQQKIISKLPSNESNQKAQVPALDIEKIDKWNQNESTSNFGSQSQGFTKEKQVAATTKNAKKLSDDASDGYTSQLSQNNIDQRQSQDSIYNVMPSLRGKYLTRVSQQLTHQNKEDIQKSGINTDTNLEKKNKEMVNQNNQRMFKANNREKAVSNESNYLSEASSSIRDYSIANDVKRRIFENQSEDQSKQNINYSNSTNYF